MFKLWNQTANTVLPVKVIFLYKHVLTSVYYKEAEFSVRQKYKCNCP